MKTIEEAAKSAINANSYFMADPSNPSFVDRGIEQYRAMIWMANYIMSLPLADRLTADEREKIKAKYQGEVEFAQFYQMKANSCVNQQCRRDYEVSRDIAKSRALILESIFGKAMFEEEGGDK